MKVSSLTETRTAASQIAAAGILLAGCTWVCSFRPSPEEVDAVREEIKTQLEDVVTLLQSALPVRHDRTVCRDRVHPAIRAVWTAISRLTFLDVPTVETMTDLETEVLSALNAEWI